MTEEMGIIDKEKAEQPFNIYENIALAKNNGKSPFSQVSDIVKLGMGPGKITPQEYYYYRLFDDHSYSFEEKSRFIGHKAQARIINTCNHDFNYWCVAHDKLLFYTLMKALDLPTVEITALYHPFRYLGSIPLLKTEEELSNFLKTDMQYPFFSKPVGGIFSTGAAYIKGYNKKTESLLLEPDGEISIGDFIIKIQEYAEDGYVFQKVLQQHDLLRETCGNRISSVRVVLTLADDRPEIICAAWKIIAGNNVADNFWRKGNLLADIDVDSGKVKSVVQGYGHEQIMVETHPDTGRPISELTLPFWEKVKETCVRAAAAIPWLNLQAWDVAISPEGPVLIEVNIGGDFNIPQIASGKGLLDERLKDLIKKCRRSAKSSN